jgi:Mg-chelatase subunit ChlD
MATVAFEDPDAPTHPFMEAQASLEARMVELPAGWEAARQYHRLRNALPAPLRRQVLERAVAAILARARRLLRHAARPTRHVKDAFPAEGDLDLERTLETPRPWKPEDIAVERVEPREADVVAILDMSLSMTGEKIALVALAASILRLKLDRLAVVAFDTTAHRLVRVGESTAPRELVRRVLEVPAQGYTNIEAGLVTALDELGRTQRRERVAILMSDGIANVGWDPVRVAARFPRLHVVQVGPEERDGTKNCLGMARAGRGRHYRAVTYEQLPLVVRRLVRDVFRA